MSGTGASARPRQELNAPGLAGSRGAILDLLKRGGSTTIPRIAAALGLNVETVRDHLKSLTGMGLVRRRGSRRTGPGRPEIIFGLTPDAESLFPRREGEMLRGLAAWLKETGREEILHEYFDRVIADRRQEALARVAPLEGAARLREVARILTELGFMAEIEGTPEEPRLRLCHCPLRELVDVSRAPCRAEIGFVRELLGEPLARVSYIPSGDASCSYEAPALHVLRAAED